MANTFSTHRCSPFIGLALLLATPMALAAPAAYWQKTLVQASNPLSQAREQALVCIDLNSLGTTISERGLPAIKVDGQWLKVGLFDCDGDQKIDSLSLHLDFTAREKKQLELYWPTQGSALPSAVTAKKTQAELAMRVGGVANKAGQLEGGEYLSLRSLTLPAEHSVGDKLFKYEGLGWESSKAAYRWYFDHRSAIDIFGKQAPELVLDKIGLDHTDYHSLSDWGMDVLKVGPSLGLGAMASWSKQSGVNGVNKFEQAQAEILTSGDASGMKLDYINWQTQDGAVDFSAQLWIQPNSALTRVSTASSTPLSHWATGIVRHGLRTLNSTDDKGTWRYMATWGKQSLANDNLGMAIFFRQKDLHQQTQDDYNHLAIFNAGASSLYYLAAYWRLPGIDTKATFEAELEAELARLNNPIIVTASTSQSSTTQPVKKP